MAWEILAAALGGSAVTGIVAFGSTYMQAKGNEKQRRIERRVNARSESLARVGNLVRDLPPFISEMVSTGTLTTENLSRMHMSTLTAMVSVSSMDGDATQLDGLNLKFVEAIPIAQRGGCPSADWVVECLRLLGLIEKEHNRLKAGEP